MILVFSGKMNYIYIFFNCSIYNVPDVYYFK